MGIWLALLFFVFAGLSGVGVYASMERIGNYEKALVGQYYLLQPTDREINDWEQKDRNFEIMQKQQEIDRLKRGPKTDDMDFILKQSEDFIAHLKTYPPGHNPPQKEIVAMIGGARTERNYYALGTVILFGLSVYLFRRSAT